MLAFSFLQNVNNKLHHQERICARIRVGRLWLLLRRLCVGEATVCRRYKRRIKRLMHVGRDPIEGVRHRHHATNTRRMHDKWLRQRLCGQAAAATVGIKRKHVILLLHLVYAWFGGRSRLLSHERVRVAAQLSDGQARGHTHNGRGVLGRRGVYSAAKRICRLGPRTLRNKILEVD